MFPESTQEDLALNRAYRLADFFGKQIGDMGFQLGKLRSDLYPRRNYCRIIDFLTTYRENENTT
jgi:hypothetical protein